jgi:hypothetical protein
VAKTIELDSKRLLELILAIQGDTRENEQTGIINNYLIASGEMVTFKIWGRLAFWTEIAKRMKEPGMRGDQDLCRS